MNGPANVQGRVWSKDNASRIHQKEIRIPKSSGLNGSEDVRRTAAGDAAQDIGGGTASFVEKVRRIRGRNTELAKAMKQIRTIARSRAAGDRGCGPAWGDYRPQIPSAGRRRNVRRHLRLAGAP